MKLIDLGWNSDFEKYFIELNSNDATPARVIAQQRNNYSLLYEHGVINAKLSGRICYSASKKNELPVVGDWVAVKILKDEMQAIIYDVLPRKTRFVRKLPISGGRKIKNGIVVGGTTEEQVIASNVDIVFIVIASLRGWNNMP